jgi:IS1 family transposase
VEDDKEIGISWVWDDEDSRTFILIRIKPINISIYCTDKYKIKYKKSEI